VLPPWPNPTPSPSPSPALTEPRTGRLQPTEPASSVIAKRQLVFNQLLGLLSEIEVSETQGSLRSALLINGSARTHAFSEGASDQGEIREADDTVPIEVGGTPASIAKELAE
jgi:hypothetical protein